MLVWLVLRRSDVHEGTKEFTGPQICLRHLHGVHKTPVSGERRMTHGRVGGMAHSHRGNACRDTSGPAREDYKSNYGS